MHDDLSLFNVPPTPPPSLDPDVEKRRRVVADTPGPVHRDAHDTEVIAAAVPGKGTLRARVLALYASAATTVGGLTDAECAALLDHRKPWSVATRRGELVQQGLIDKTDERRAGHGAGLSIVWRINDEGRRIAAQIGGE